MKIKYQAGLDYCQARGVNAYRHNDLDFGVNFVYCDAHEVVHKVGHCRVANFYKVALDFPALDDAVTAAKRMGLI